MSSKRSKNPCPFTTELTKRSIKLIENWKNKKDKNNWRMCLSFLKKKPLPRTILNTEFKWDSEENPFTTYGQYNFFFSKADPISLKF